MRTPSKYQKRIFEWTANHEGKSLVVNAVAGSGKTTTAIENTKLVPDNEECIFIAFNSAITKEMQTKLPAGKFAKTYHSLGKADLVEAFGPLEVDTEKDSTKAHTQRYIDKYKYGFLVYPTMQLLAYCKNNLIPEPSVVDLQDLIIYHSLNLYGLDDMVIDTVQNMLRDTMEWARARKLTKITFDDMVFLPPAIGLKGRPYDFITVDEVQDTNKAQLELIISHLGPDSRLIGIGDVKQSIYNFRGADSEAIPNLIARLHADTLPLSITYRNPQSVVNLVNQKFPEIDFHGRDNAPEGSVNTLSVDKFLDTVQPGNMVVCRTNAPMVGYVFQLIRKGIKAQIKGRDIGKGLLQLIKKMKETDVNKLILRLSDYREIEAGRLYMQDKNTMAQQLEDKVDTLIALTEGCTSVDMVTAKIDTVFADEVEGITFSSIHKAKGLEAEHVFILKPDLLPHPMASRKNAKPWEMVQEKNLEYVAITRVHDGSLNYVLE